MRRSVLCRRRDPHSDTHTSGTLWTEAIQHLSAEVFIGELENSFAHFTGIPKTSIIEYVLREGVGLSCRVR
jgi:hypothetical protein